jgi:glycosyltransferase involved in cell wall biosynthesis
VATTLVSVVVPVWNGAPFLRECLDSLVAQDHTPIEIIVVDDGSTDESAAVAEEFGHAIVVRQPHRGLGAARNTGIERASGPLVGFCDADDTWLPHKARVQVAYLDEHPDIGIVLCRQETTFEAGVAAPDWLLPDQIRGDLDGIGLASGLCRSGVFTRLDGFRTDMTIGTDFNLLIRARTAGIGIAVIEEQLTTRRIHGDNMTTRDRTAKQALLQSVREHLKAKSR